MNVDILLAIAIGTLSVTMSVVGGILATEKRFLRFLFIAMGVLSIVFVAYQTMRTTKSQDELANSLEKVRAMQAQLGDLATGGKAFPSLWVIGLMDDDGTPGNATIYVKNNDDVDPLYSVSISYSRVNKGQIWGASLLLHDVPGVIAEIVPEGEFKLPVDFPFDDSVRGYEFEITARNGTFTATVEWISHRWISTIKRKGSDSVLERTADDPMRRSQAEAHSP